MSIERVVRPRSAAVRVEIREVQTEAELREVFRLRYRVFRREGTQPPHPAELDVDAWDARCRYVGAWEGGRLVAAARMILAEGPFPWEAAARRLAPSPPPEPARPLFCETLFDLGDLLRETDGPVAEFGRTVCDPDRRGAGLGSVMVHAVHGLGLRHGVRVGFGTPLTHLVDFYERLGARVLAGHATRRHREHAAEMVPVIVDLGVLPLARRAADALAQDGRILWCGDRDCLERHDHEPRATRHGVAHRARRQPRPVAFQLHDETLRDGLQSPSVREPGVDDARELLHRMADLGVESANLGLPGAGPRALELSLALAREIREQGLPLLPTCAGRTHRDDIDAIAEVARLAGCRLEAGLFLGSSPLRLWAEGWTEDDLVRRIEDTIPYAVQRGLDVMFVTEDTVRAQPQTLRRLFTAALDCGATRLCLCDTVGHATPEGVRALVGFVKDLLADLGRTVPLDWHGHRDRGLAVANTLAAVRAGVARVHATAGGVGERVGNTPMGSLLRVLDATGLRPCDLGALDRYDRTAERVLRMEVGR